MAQDETGSDVSDLAYEQAREELIAIVARIESGDVPLEESMRLWERGEALAAHCQRLLDAAQQQLDKADPASGSPAQSSDTSAPERPATAQD